MVSTRLRVLKATTSLILFHQPCSCNGLDPSEGTESICKGHAGLKQGRVAMVSTRLRVLKA